MFELIGAMAAILTMFSFVPQIIKVYRTRSAHDVSLGTIIQMSCGVILWIVYGLYLHNRIIIFANIITITTLLVLLILYFLYKDNKNGIKIG